MRVRSAENVVAELEYLAKLGVHNIHMYADLFTVNREHVVSLCRLIVERKLNIKWSWATAVSIMWTRKCSS